MPGKKDLLRLLVTNDVLAILIGGLALRIYNSPRVTHDMDLAIRTLDADQVIQLMYRAGYLLVTGVDDQWAYVHQQPQEAVAWLEQSSVASMTFVQVSPRSSGASVPLHCIDITTQVDYLFDLTVPIMRLKERAQAVRLDDFTILVAAPEDLLLLKKDRRAKTAADYADIQFLENLIDDGTST